jgi:hypothetical protein
MRRLYCVVDDLGKPEPRVSLVPTTPILGPRTASSRWSPVFSVGEAEPLQAEAGPFTGLVLLAYTLDSYYALGRLNSVMSFSAIRGDLFLTPGLASILHFAASEEEHREVLSRLSDLVFATETWYVDQGRLLTNEYSGPAAPATSYPELPKVDIPLEYEWIFHTLWPSVERAKTLSGCYVPKYVPLFDGLSSTVNAFLGQIRYLVGASSPDEYAKWLVEQCGYGEESARKILLEVETATRLGPDKAVRLAQLKDEALTLSAVLQYVVGQAFGGLPPLLTSPLPPSVPSLFGFGGSYSALVAMYTKARNAFELVHPSLRVEQSLASLRNPGFPANWDDLGKWITDLEETPSLDDMGLPKHLPEAVYQAPYFSNRLGFRSTKHSVSAARQSMALAAVAPWSLTTLTHEYLHGHVASLLALILPLDGDKSTSFHEAYAALEAELDGGGPKWTTPLLLQALVLYAFTLIRSFDSTGNGQSGTAHLPREDVLYEYFLAHHREVYELLVHILDYQYFYANDTSFYLYSIWSSWLTLPVIHQRTIEYLSRSICAICAADSGSYVDRFNRAVKVLIRQLESIRAQGHVDHENVTRVIDALEDPHHRNALRLRLAAWLPLAEAVVHYFFSPELMAGLLTDDQADQTADFRSKYPLKPGEFIPLRVDSPFSLLGHAMRLLNQGEQSGRHRREPVLTELSTLDEIHAFSQWLFALVASSLYAREVDDERECAQ